MFPTFLPGGRDSLPPPPPYNETDPAPSPVRNRSHIHVGDIHGSGTSTIPIGNIIRPGEDIFDIGNVGTGTIYHGLVSATGNQSIRISNDPVFPRPVSPVPPTDRNSRMIKFTMFKDGIKINGSVVSAPSREIIKLTGGKTVVVSPHGDKQLASVLSVGYPRFELTFHHRRDVVSFQRESGSPVKLRDGVAHAVTAEITVERRDDVVTVRYF